MRRSGERTIHLGESEQRPSPRETLENVLPSILELYPRTRYEVADGSRHKNFPGRSLAHHPLRQVHPYPAYVRAEDLTLARVQPDSNGQTEPRDRSPDGSCAL
jgi:hypothetical protein